MQRGTLYATLTRAAFHRRLSLTLRLLLLAGAALPVWLFVLFAADNLFNLSVALRTALGLVSLGAIAAGAARLYWLYWRSPADNAKMAVYLEQRYGIDDNRLINAVHFDRDPKIPPYIKEVFTNAAESSCAGMSFQRVWQNARLKPALKLCAVGLLLFLAYAVPFGSHARNAFLRFLNPSTSVTPLNYTQFAVAPGDAEIIEGSPCLIRATAAKYGRPAAGLDILVKDGSTPLLYPMRSGADGFVFELRDLSRDTRYAVRNGNDSSRWYTVSVIRRPRLDKLSITVTPPAYTGEKPLSLSPSKRGRTSSKVRAYRSLPEFRTSSMPRSSGIRRRSPAAHSTSKCLRTAPFRSTSKTPAASRTPACGSAASSSPPTSALTCGC